MKNHELHGTLHQLLEWEYTSRKHYSNPFNALELDVQIVSPNKESWIVPTFWKGDHSWTVRFIPKEVGLYTITTICTDKKNDSLHHIVSTLQVSIQDNQITPQRHSHLSITQNKRYLEDSQKKPFFWLADTWWMGLSKRLSFPADFKILTEDRKNKGFTVIQLVIGLFPDMNHFDKRCENEAGLPWEEEYARINPHYFDKADERLEYLVDSNLIPCILGAWGYYIHKMGEEKMKQHWRYIIARWGVYPVVWAIAGEGAMPYYLSTNGQRDRDRQIKSWTNIGNYIKKIDPFHHLVTIHPTDSSRTQVSDELLLDFTMLQAGHSGYPSVENAMRLINEDNKIQPAMPTIMSEVNYEGIMHDTSAELQRLTFWTSILSGSAGFTYGANGIWQVNTKETPFGASPHGGTWGNTPWSEAMHYLGSKHIGLAKKLLEQYPWWQMQPHQEWISSQHEPYNYKAPRIAGIPSQLRIIYFYGPIHPWSEPKYYIAYLEEGVKYKAHFWDPRTAKKYPIGIISPNANNQWRVPTLPTFDDWILILEATEDSHPLAMEESVEIQTYQQNISLLKKILRKIKQKICH